MGKKVFRAILFILLAFFASSRFKYCLGFIGISLIAGGVTGFAEVKVCGVEERIVIEQETLKRQMAAAELSGVKAA